MPNSQINPNATWQQSVGDVPAPSIPPAISSTALTGTQNYTVPPQQPPQNYAPTAASSLSALQQSVANFDAQIGQQEGFNNSLIKEIMGTSDFLGTQGAREQALAQQYGKPEMDKQVKQLLAQANALQMEAAAIPLNIEQNFEGRAGMVQQQNMTREQLRQNTIKSLGVNARGQFLLGNIAQANEDIDRAIAAEFGPAKQRLASLEKLYTFNKDALERTDKKRADALDLFINEQNRLVAIEEADKKEIYDIGKTAMKYGADSDTAAKIFAAKTKQEALQAAGQYTQDPKAKYELESARMDNLLKKAQIEKTNYELNLLKQYGGLTPAQYAEKLKAEEKAIKEAKDAAEAARLQGRALQTKMTLLGTVLDSKAIDSVVGPSIFARAAGSAKSFLGRIAGGAATGAAVGAGVGAFAGGIGALPGALGGAAIGAVGGLGLASQGTADYFSGNSDALIGQTEQFISKEFIDSLISAKAQGATFGALTKTEQDALTAAATFIGQRRVYAGKGEDKYVVGYDMSETDFKRELKTIKDLTQKAYEKASGSSWTPDEQDFWAKLQEETASGTFNPAY